MEENEKRRIELFNGKTILIVIASIFVIIVCALGVKLLYKYFYNENMKTIQTVASKEEQADELIIKVDDNLIVEEINNSEEISEEERLLEEQKQKEEEEKRKQEEQRKKEQEQKKQQAQDLEYSQQYKYYIKVNYTANTVTVYTLDANGNYTIPVRAMICSTGSATPHSGVYRTLNKYRWKLLLGNVQGQYSTRITGQILFHSVPYSTTSEGSLIAKYYDKLGITTSMGCIRLTVIDAKWIYDNCPLGTKVEFYSSSDPGPLGKPSAKKISGYGYPLNSWDPTDPNPNNPWNAQKNEEEARKKAEEEAARKKAEEEAAAQKKAEEEAKKKAEEEAAKKKAEEEARKKAEEEAARKKAEEEARKKAEEEEARKKAEEEAKKQVTIPNVIGKNYNEAKTTLINLGLKVEFNYKSDKDKDEGIVLAQSISANSKAQKGSTIIITVNKIEVEP